MGVGVPFGGNDSSRLLAKAIAVVIGTILLGSFPVGHAKADTATGIDYRELRTAAGSLNTGTTVTIASFLSNGAGNYVIDPITAGSTLKGTPSSTTPSGYGWKTAGFFGQNVPAGTWTFNVETTSTLISSGEALARVYAYATDILGTNVEPIGTATGTTNRFNALGTPVSEALSFSASEIDLTNKVLVVEYWIIVNTAPLLESTITFNSGSSVASVVVPTSSPTTFYLLPARVISFGDSFAVSDSTGRMLHALRGTAESVATSDSINFRVTRSTIEAVAVTEQIRTRVSRSMEESVGVADDLGTDFIPGVASTVAFDDSIARTYFASRSVSDGAAFADSISTAVTRSVAETLATTEELSGKVTGRAISDALAIVGNVRTNVAPSIADAITAADSISKTASYPLVDSLAAADSIAARVALRAISDQLSVGDAISTSVSRALSESVALADSAQRTYLASRTAADGAAIADAISKVAAKPALDAVAFADSIRMSVLRSAADSLSLQDSVRMSVTRSVSETLAAGDSITTLLSAQRAVSESLAVADLPSTAISSGAAEALAISDAVVATYQALRTAGDSLEVTDMAAATAAIARLMPDGVAFADVITTTTSRSMVDSLAVTDVPAKSAALQASESITVADAASIADAAGRALLLQRSLSESVAVGEGVAGGIMFARSATDSVSVQDVAERSPARTPGDSVAIEDEITGVAVSWSRTFEESLALEDCTPFSCSQSLHLGESLSLADTFSPPPALQDTLSVSDGIVANTAASGTAADAVTVADGISITIWPAPESPLSGSPLPLLGPLVVSEAALAGPLPPEPVPGQFTMSDGGLAQLASQLGLPSTEIDSVSGSDLPDMAVVLPTYHVTLSPSDELPGDDVLMTVMVAEIPAETEIIMSVDIASTPELAEHDNVPLVALEFTPAVDASDFALAASILDSPPNGAPEPRGGLFPLYLDIRWAGTFGGAVDPGIEGFYSDQPTLTFALTEEWADESDVERDENGVPEITLNLLDESTGEWEEITDIDFPAGATDGQYVYVAHLEHFSTYAAAASEDTGGSGSSGSASARLSVQLVDSLVLSEEQNSLPDAGSWFAVQLLDRVSIESKPVAYWPLASGENVSVLVTVTDIRPAGTFPPAANAAVLAEIANMGTERKSFVLEFWHGSRPGTSLAVEIGPGESRRVLAEVPFTSPGEQALNVEARTTDGDLIAYRQMTFEVSWLAVYFPLLTALLGGLAAAAGAGLYLFARSKFA